MQCGTTSDCDNDADLMPVVVFPLMPGARGEGKCRFPFAVCEAHASPDPADYMTKEGWARVQATFEAQGHVPPIWDNLRVEFERIER